MRDLNDQIIVASCIQGDKRAWNDFVSRFSPLVLWAIKERLGRTNIGHNQQDIQDILQNVFVLLWEKSKLKQIRNRKRVSTWLVMVAANCALNHFRRQKETPCRKEDLSTYLPSSDCTVANDLDQEKLHSLLENIFDHLNAREQIALKLHYFYNKGQGEIAEILKIPQNSVSSIIKRAKDKIRQELENSGWER